MKYLERNYNSVAYLLKQPLSHKPIYDALMFLGFWIRISPDTEEQTNLCFEWDICIINHYCFSDSLFCDFKGIVHPEMKTVIICSVITPSSETCVIFFLWNPKWDLAQKSLKLETVELQKRQLLPCEISSMLVHIQTWCLKMHCTSFKVKDVS